MKYTGSKKILLSDIIVYPIQQATANELEYLQQQEKLITYSLPNGKTESAEMVRIKINPFNINNCYFQ